MICQGLDATNSHILEQPVSLRTSRRRTVYTRRSLYIYYTVCFIFINIILYYYVYIKNIKNKKITGFLSFFFKFLNILNLFIDLLSLLRNYSKQHPDHISGLKNTPVEYWSLQLDIAISEAFDIDLNGKF